MKLRPFTESDWDGFAGCEDKEPLISDEILEINIVGNDYIGQLIIDGFDVVIQLSLKSYLDDDEVIPASVTEHDHLNEEMTLMKSCMTKNLAKIEAAKIRTDTGPSWFFSHGFKLD